MPSPAQMSFAFMPDSQAIEVLVGIMTTLSITSGIRVLSPGSPEIGQMVITALVTNTAWGMVDGVFHLFNIQVERAREQRLLSTFNQADTAQTRREALAELAPQALVHALDDAQIRAYQLSSQMPVASPHALHIQREDLRMALRLWSLMVLSTVPTALPLVLIDDPLAAFRWSQAVSVGIMFALGIPVARWVGMRPWMGGALFAALGSIITFVCIALGG